MKRGREKGDVGDPPGIPAPASRGQRGSVTDGWCVFCGIGPQPVVFAYGTASAICEGCADGAICGQSPLQPHPCQETCAIETKECMRVRPL